MNENELGKHRCCFTGHRPDKLQLPEKEIKKLLTKAIDEAMADGIVIKTFYVISIKYLQMSKIV